MWTSLYITPAYPLTHRQKEALASKLPASSKAPLRGVKPGVRPVQAKSKIPSPPSAFDSPSSTLSTPTSHVSQSKSKSKSRPAQSSQAQSRSRVPGPPPGKAIPHGNTKPANKTPREDRDDEGERLFWSGKKPPRFNLEEAIGSGSLLDEELDMSGMDALMSPTPSMPSSSRAPNTPEAPAGDYGDQESFSTYGTSPVDDDAENQDEDDDDDDSGEPTIVISKLAQPAPATAPPSPPPSRPISQTSTSEPQTPAHDGKNVTAPPPSTKTKVRRVRVTPEVERVCVRRFSSPLLGFPVFIWCIG